MPDRRTVAVTGASGDLASLFLERLAADEDVHRILGFDLQPPSFRHPKFLFDQVDARDPALEARFAGVDQVVHLAFVMNPIRDELAMRDVNVNGSQNVFRCAGRAGVKHLTYTSSAVAYGAHPDNEVPLTEGSPLRANLDFNYAAHKLEVEYVVREIEDAFPDLKICVLRPTFVMGPHIDSAWTHLIELPVAIGVSGYSPPHQFVHELDVARALCHSVTNSLDGPFNVAPDGWLSHEQTLELAGRRTIDLPEPIAFALAERLWALGMAEAPAGFLHYAMHPWVVSSEKLKDTGFTFSRSNRETFAEAVSRSVGYVRFGKNRVPRAAMRRVALGSAGALAALVSLRTAKRRFSANH